MIKLCVKWVRGGVTPGGLTKVGHYSVVTTPGGVVGV